LIAGDKVIPDSSAILDWLEETRPEPALLPRSAKERAMVTLWEEIALNAMGPHGRTLITGRLLRIDDPEAQKSGKYFAEKYGYSEFAEEQSRLTATRILTSLRDTLSGRQYLVGDTFSRADVTVAAMLMLWKAAPQEFFVFTPELRFVYLDKLGDDPAFSEVFAWRDRMYRDHRGEVVKP
jgi:glutathione S-transferase